MTMRTAVLACLTCGALALGACAPADGPWAWQSVGLGGGGGIFVPATSPHDPDLMFCASDMSGVYRSTDGGRSWRMIHFRDLSGAIGWPVVFHPTDPKVLYCIPSGYNPPVLKVSRDAGVTWRALCEAMPWHEQTPQSTHLAIGPRGKVLLVSSEAGTFRSDDGGRTWTTCKGIDGRAANFFIDPAAGAPWYAATAEAVLRSRDEGRSWRPAAGQGLSGGIWDLIGGKDPRTGRVALYVLVPTRPVGGKLTGGVFRSDDGGATWRRAMGEGINTNVVGPAAGGRQAFAQYPAIAMAANQTERVYVFCYGTGRHPPNHRTVYRTDDGGKHWRAVMFMPPGMKRRNVDLPWIVLDRGHGGRILGFSVNARDGDVVAWTDMMQIFRTDDGGRRWRQVYTRCADGEPAPGKRWAGIGLEMTSVWRFEFHPRDPKRCYICYTDIGFARSEDRGRTWRYAAHGSPWTNTFYDVAFDPDRPNVLYAACAYEHDIPSWKMAGKVYGGGGVCLSTDHGATWRPISDGLPKLGACTAVAIDPASPAHARVLYCSFYGGGVFKTADGGKTWKPVNKGLNVKRNDHFTDVKRCADGTLYALCGGKRLARYKPARGSGLYKSTDGGASWTELTAKLGVWLAYGFDVHPDDPDTLWVCASAVPRRHDEAGVYKSADGGKTWKRLAIDWPPARVGWLHARWPGIDPKDPARVWVTSGTHGTIVTTDGGKSWSEVKGIPFRGGTRITVDPDDRDTIWVGTFGGGVWRGPALGTH